MAPSKQSYPSETIGAITATTVPTCAPAATVTQVLHMLAQTIWDDAHYVYVTNEQKHLVGVITISDVLKASHSKQAQAIMQPIIASLTPDADQERVVFLALKHDIDAIPVTKNGVLLGAVTPKTIIDIMHNEHVEDTLIASGIRHRGSNILQLATANLGHVVASRAPWLIVGALAGIALGFIASQFEASLEKSIALAYFIPVVAYIADSVGTQSEAITIRALATLKLNYPVYLMRELLMGLALGVVLGIMGAIGAILISHSAVIGFVVGLSLLTASTIAASLAAFIPIFFKILGKDPALGSGPLATALQDMLSVLIYFLFAILFVR